MTIPGGALAIGDGTEDETISCERFDAKTNTWKPAANAPIYTDRVTFALRNGDAFLYSKNTWSVYDHAKNRWSKAATLTDAEKFDVIRVALLGDSKVIVTGVLLEGKSLVGSISTLYVRTGKRERLGPLALGLGQPYALSDGRVLLNGGNESKGVEPEIWDAKTKSSRGLQGFEDLFDIQVATFTRAWKKVASSLSGSQLPDPSLAADFSASAESRATELATKCFRE